MPELTNDELHALAVATLAEQGKTLRTASEAEYLEACNAALAEAAGPEPTESQLAAIPSAVRSVITERANQLLAEIRDPSEAETIGAVRRAELELRLRTDRRLDDIADETAAAATVERKMIEFGMSGIAGGAA